ncbi:hypothetical protein V8F20_006823 [Naviculisporaceae sp. PSN 640]
MSEAFQWFREQATIPSLDGRYPLHHIYPFLAEAVADIVRILTNNGAEVNVVDKDGFRPVDYAIMAGRDDVVELLFERGTPLFTSRDLHSADMTTCVEALASGSSSIITPCLEHVDRNTRFEILSKLSGHYSMLAVCDSYRMIRTILAPMPRLTPVEIEHVSKARHMVDPSRAEHVKAALMNTICLGGLTIFEDIFNSLLPKSATSLEFVNQLLIIALLRFRESEFRLILTIPAVWTASMGYNALKTMVLMSGPVSGICSAFVTHLQGLGLLTEVMNYTPPGECEPTCDKKHNHLFHETIFAGCVRAGRYEIARVLAEHVDCNPGRPTALWYLLQASDRKILDHIDSLMDIGEPHNEYLVYPLTNRTALQVACDNHYKFKSPREFMEVLETLLEYYIRDRGEDINAPSSDGFTALCFAADCGSPEAVRVLLDWGADPCLQLSLRPITGLLSELGGTHSRCLAAPSCLTPYEYVLLKIYANQVPRTVNQLNTLDSSSITTPKPKSHNEKMAARLMDQLSALAMLSLPGGVVSETELASLLDTDSTVLDHIRGSLTTRSLIPTTKMRWAQLVEGGGGGEQYLAVWGYTILRDYRVSAQVTPVDTMSSQEISTQTQYYKKLASPRPPGSQPQPARVVMYMSCLVDQYLCQVLIEYLEGNGDMIKEQDCFLRGGVLTCDAMKQELERSEGAFEEKDEERCSVGVQAWEAAHGQGDRYFGSIVIEGKLDPDTFLLGLQDDQEEVEKRYDEMHERFGQITLHDDDND